MKQVIGYISVCNTFGLEVRDIIDDCVFANWSFDPDTEYTCPIIWNGYDEPYFTLHDNVFYLSDIMRV